MILSKSGLIEGPFLFVVNPNSGTGKVNLFLNMIISYKADFKFEVVVSKSQNHSIELAKTAGSNGFKAVIAVGGDGSVHEIGTQLIGSEIALGIIPVGSGNGIARHLGISMDIRTAVEQMLTASSRPIDTLYLNERPFIGFAGFGLDAHVAHLFDRHEKRGFTSYLKLTANALYNYEATHFIVKTEQDKREIKAIAMIFANINQFGNNAYINPLAEDDDGLFEIIILSPDSKWNYPELATRLFLKNLHTSKFVTIVRTNYARIQNLDRAKMQVDGEAFDSELEIEVKSNPKSLNVLIPNHGF